MNKPICGIYRHYKGGIYEVIDTAKHSETLEELVVYRNISTDACWVRPVSMWSETVFHHGRNVLRFQYTASDIDDMDSKRLFQTIEDIVELGEMYDALSDDNCIAYCRKATDEVACFLHGMGYYTDGEHDERTLNHIEKPELEKLNFIAEYG
ncbi:MAG: DUF1653 domain-containing protein [Clostridia bacterium]